MKHFIRTAFWIFTLFGCLLAIPRRLMEADFADSDFNVAYLSETIKCDQGSTFYSQKNWRPECITAALHCFHQEFNGTVRMECGDDDDQIDDVLYILQSKINARVKAGHILNDSTACACEQGSLLPFPDFLNATKYLLEKIKQLEKQS